MPRSSGVLSAIANVHHMWTLINFSQDCLSCKIPMALPHGAIHRNKLPPSQGNAALIWPQHIKIMLWCYYHNNTMVTLLSACNSRQLLPVVTCQVNLPVLIKTTVKRSFLYSGFTWAQSRCTQALLHISSRNCGFSYVYKRKEQQLQANGVVQGCQGDWTHVVKQWIYR